MIKIDDGYEHTRPCMCFPAVLISPSRAVVRKADVMNDTLEKLHVMALLHKIYNGVDMALVHLNG